MVNPPINPPEKTWRFACFVQADASKAGIGLFLCAHRLGGLHRMLGTKAGTKHGDFCWIYGGLLKKVIFLISSHLYKGVLWKLMGFFRGIWGNWRDFFSLKFSGQVMLRSEVWWTWSLRCWCLSLRCEDGILQPGIDELVGRHMTWGRWVGREGRKIPGLFG